MFIFKNAIKSISRTKGRNILVGVIIVVIALSSCVALSIKQSAADLMADGVNSTKVTATISVNREQMMSASRSTTGGNARTAGGIKSAESIAMADYQKLADLPSVGDFYYSEQISLKASDDTVFSPYKTASDSTTTEQSTTTTGPSGRAGNPNHFGILGLDGDFSVTGYSSESAMTDFISGTKKITSGKLFDNFETPYNSDTEISCVISQNLADFNDFTVGQTFQVVNPNNTAEIYTFKIDGFYSYEATTDSQSKEVFANSAPALDPANAIYVNSKVVDTITAASAIAPITVSSQTPMGNQTGTSEFKPILAPTYQFNSPNAYEGFKTAAESVMSTVNPAVKIVTEDFKISSTDVDNYEKSLIPLQNLDNFATTLLLIILIVGAIILTVLTLFNIRERKYEVGVLTAIGIKKPKVALQFAVEFLVVSMLSILVGAGIGAVASVPVANAMLDTQVQSQKAEVAAQTANMGRGPGGQQVIDLASMKGGQPEKAKDVSYIDSIGASINLTVLLQLIGIGLLMTVISSLVGISFVSRYEPLQILADRS